MTIPRTTHDRKKVWAPIAILFLAATLRTPQLVGPRFHPDEALFASFARSIAVWRDPLLSHAPVDKPPLLFYLQALCYPFLGPKEMAARLVNYFASILTVALTMTLVSVLLRQLLVRHNRCSDKVCPEGRGSALASLFAGLFIALSPLTIAFGPTAFTDPLMVMWCMAALVAAAGGKPAWSGLWLGLGLGTKYQAAFFAPLVFYLLIASGRKKNLSDWAKFLGTALLPVVLVLLWDAARKGSFSLIEKQFTGYGGLYLVPLDELFPKLVDWLKMSWYLTGSSLAGVVLVLSFLIWIFGTKHKSGNSYLDRVVFVLAGWLAVYAGLHWMLNAQVWDRYLLPAVPIIAVLAGCVLVKFGSGERNKQALAVMLVLILLMLTPAIKASMGELPIGGDHGAYDGIEQVADFFAHHPYGTVLYDHWLSWELRYYLFDSRVYVSWFFNAAGLVTDLEAFDSSPPRYLIVPSWKNPDTILESIRQSGFAAERVFSATRPDKTVSFIVWEITRQ